jgi:hypothetical protein
MCVRAGPATASETAVGLPAGASRVGGSIPMSKACGISTDGSRITVASVESVFNLMQAEHLAGPTGTAPSR